MDWFEFIIALFVGAMIGASILAAFIVFKIDDGDCAGHVAPNKPIPNFTPPKPNRFTKVNVDRYGNEIDVGDTVWYQGEKWTVNVLHCLSYDDCKLHLINSSRNYCQWVDVDFVKKVFRANSYADNNNAN